MADVISDTLKRVRANCYAERIAATLIAAHDLLDSEFPHSAPPSGRISEIEESRIGPMTTAPDSAGPGLVERCIRAACASDGSKCSCPHPEFPNVWCDPMSRITRTVLAEFVAALREPEMVQWIGCSADIGDHVALAVIDVIAREVYGESGGKP